MWDEGVEKGDASAAQPWVEGEPRSPNRKWRRQYRHPPLQRTQGWGTLCGNGAYKQPFR
jgi:hypothetical protein